MERPSLLRIASLFIQVIPVCLFLAHDQNYDAIFRSQYEEGEKNTHKRHRLGTLREVHVI